MATITQLRCDIDKCTETAAFNSVEITAKGMNASGLQLTTVKLDLCAKHRQEMINRIPITIEGGAYKL